MDGEIRLTRRGKIAVALGILLVAIAVNAVFWGKNVACDWSNGSVEPCSIQPMTTKGAPR